MITALRYLVLVAAVAITWAVILLALFLNHPPSP